MKHKRIVYASVILLLGIIGASYYLFQGKTTAPAVEPAMARQIPQDTYFSDVQKLSRGSKPACLTEDPTLKDVSKKDGELPYMQSFGSIIGSVIPDMPAGLYDNYVATASDTNVTGNIVFSDKNQVAKVGSLNSFNYAVSRGDIAKPWTLASFIACSPGK